MMSPVIGEVIQTALNELYSYELVGTEAQQSAQRLFSFKSKAFAKLFLQKKI